MKMLLNAFAGISKIIPKNLRIGLTRKMIYRFVDAYSEIEIINKSIIEERKGTPTIYIGNHLSNVDGLILNRILKDNDVAFLAGVKLSKNTITNLVLETVKTININPNTADKKAIKEAIQHLKGGGSIFIFPEGTRSRTGSMIEAKKGFILLAKMSRAQFVPIGLEGTQELLPINGENMGGEWFNHANVKVKVGQPFDLLERNEDNKEIWTEAATEHSMIKIAELLDPQYQGFYKD